MTQHKDLELFAKNIRIQVLKALGELGFGHLGGAMSAADVLGVLYGGVMNVDPKNPQWEDRDYFVMCQGARRPRSVCRAGAERLLPGRAATDHQYQRNPSFPAIPTATARLAWI